MSAIALSPIAVFGATGAQGGAVVSALQAKGVPVIALTRDVTSAKAVALAALPGVTVRVGDLAKPETLDAALAGAKAVFLVTDYCTQQILPLQFVSRSGWAGCGS